MILMGTSMVSGENFPLNQSIDISLMIGGYLDSGV